MGIPALKKATLKGSTHFQELFREGKRVQESGVTVIYRATEGESGSRVAVCISKRAGGAVVRNRIKRIVREALDPSVSRLKPGYHAAVVANRGFDRLDLRERRKRIQRLFQRAGLLEKDSRNDN